MQLRERENMERQAGQKTPGPKKAEKRGKGRNERRVTVGGYAKGSSGKKAQENPSARRGAADGVQSEPEAMEQLHWRNKWRPTRGDKASEEVIKDGQPGQTKPSTMRGTEKSKG